jgi:ElaB/YqjD/DUF883 family membrane-anchored ribosome-binding protein
MDTITPSKDFHADLKAIRSDIAALTENVGKLANEASKAQAAMTKTVKRAAKTSAGIGAKMWDEATDLGRDTSEAMADATHVGMFNLQKQIKHNPVSSVLFALGIGFVVGVIGLNLRK